jgi:hypothetical protein
LFNIHVFARFSRSTWMASSNEPRNFAVKLKPFAFEAFGESNLAYLGVLCNNTADTGLVVLPLFGGYLWHKKEDHGSFPKL